MSKHNRVPMTYKGIYYACRKDAFDAAGLDEKAQERVRTYIKRHKEVDGKDLSVIIELVNSSRREKYRTVFGVCYNLKELCEHFNIGKHILELCNDYELETLLSPTVVFCKQYNNRLELLKYCNVTIEELKRCPDNKLDELIISKLYIVKDKKFKNFQDFCEHVNVNSKAYSKYLLDKGVNTSPVYAVGMLEEYIKASCNHKDRHTRNLEYKKKCDNIGISIHVVKKLMRDEKLDFDSAFRKLKDMQDSGNLRQRFTDEQVMKYKELVEKAGLKSYTRVVTNSRRGISIEHEICRLNPNCYIDKQGNLVIPPRDEWRTDFRIVNTNTFDELLRYCDNLGLDFTEVFLYRQLNKALSNMQVIGHFESNYYMNWLGELVLLT